MTICNLGGERMEIFHMLLLLVPKRKGYSGKSGLVNIKQLKSSKQRWSVSVLSFVGSVQNLSGYKIFAATLNIDLC